MPFEPHDLVGALTTGPPTSPHTPPQTTGGALRTPPRLSVRNYLGGPALTPPGPHDGLPNARRRRQGSHLNATRTVGEAVEDAQMIQDLGMRSVKVFAGSRLRDGHASQATSPTGLMARTIAAVKKAAPGLAVMTETCVCSHTDSGECWLANERDGGMDLVRTTEVLAAQAVMQAEAGADIVGPAAMIPGSVQAVREAWTVPGTVTWRSCRTSSSSPGSTRATGQRWGGHPPSVRDAGLPDQSAAAGGGCALRP
ncbi:hypothetical protein GTV15_19200 [Streptomyces sp. SID7803]|nr:hypothetical protein [Streptomyces sp. SID7803]